MTALTELTDRTFEAYNRGDVDGVVSCYAEGAVQEHPFFPAGNKGRAAIREAEGGVFAAFSDIEWRLDRAIQQGEWAAVESTVSATNTSDLPTPGGLVPATNKRITISLVNFWRLDDDGLIAEEHRYMDVAGFLGQLGLMG